MQEGGLLDLIADLAHEPATPVGETTAEFFTTLVYSWIISSPSREGSLGFQALRRSDSLLAVLYSLTAQHPGAAERRGLVFRISQKMEVDLAFIRSAFKARKAARAALEKAVAATSAGALRSSLQNLAATSDACQTVPGSRVTCCRCGLVGFTGGDCQARCDTMNATHLSKQCRCSLNIL